MPQPLDVCRPRWARALLVALLALAGARPVLAQARFEAPPGCGSELEFQRELERLLGAGAARAAPRRLVIAGPDASGEYTLRLELAEQSPELKAPELKVRELKDKDCRTLLRSAAVIAAAAARDEAPPPALAAPAPPAPARAAPAAPPPPARRLAMRRRRAVIVSPVEAAPRTESAARADAKGASGYSVFLGAGLAGGVVPGIGAAVLAGAGIEPAPFGLALSLRYTPTRRAERRGRSVDVNSLGARIDALYQLEPALNLGLGLEANRLSGTGGETVSLRQSSSAWRVASSLSLSLVPWRDIQPRVELGVSGQLVILRPHFRVDGFGDVYRVPQWGADAIIRGLWLFR